jgi:hypothetical protein
MITMSELEVHALADKFREFRNGLNQKEREVLNLVLRRAASAPEDEDVQGYLVVISVIGILVGLLLPETPSTQVPPPSK